MTDVQIPQRGTRDHEMWLAGATAEAQYDIARRKSPSGQIYGVAKVLADQGDSERDVVGYIAYVFTANWSWRQRAALCWKLLRFASSRRTWTVYRDPDDWYVGYYRGDTHHYLVLMTIVLRWKRRQAGAR